MAGIIAQLTRAARVRRDRRTYGTSKCMYTLDPFHPNGFDASIHNKFIVQKALWEEQVKRVKDEENEIVTAYKVYKARLKLYERKSLICLFQENKKSIQKAQPLSILRCCMEVLLISTMLLTIPTALLATEILFYFGTLYIPSSLATRLWAGTPPNVTTIWWWEHTTLTPPLWITNGKW